MSNNNTGKLRTARGIFSIGALFFFIASIGAYLLGIWTYEYNDELTAYLFIAVGTLSLMAGSIFLHLSIRLTAVIREEEILVEDLSEPGIKKVQEAEQTLKNERDHPMRV